MEGYTSVRTDHNFPTGFMDVVTLEKSNDRYRVMFDVKGRFVLQKLDRQEFARALVNFWLVDKMSMAAIYAFAAVNFPNRTQRSFLLTVGVFKVAEYFLLQRNMSADYHESEIIEGATLGTAALSLVAWIAPY